MRRSRKPIVIASRRSPLARVQAEMVGRALGKLNPGVEIEYHWIESVGDKITDRPLAEVGGKGLFTKSVDAAVMDGMADLAVHSLKDVPADPAELPKGLALAAVPKRGVFADCLVSTSGANSIEDLPEGATLGTSSPRRAAQALAIRPDLRIKPIRGNVETRLSKVLSENADGNYDATLLAAAGLKRLGLKEHAKRRLSVDDMLPAACQGAIGITCRAMDHVTLTRLLPLNDPATSTAVHAEREVVTGLHADCHSALCVLAEPVPPSEVNAKRNADSHWFRLRVRVLSPDGSSKINTDEKCKTGELRRCVKRTVKKLLKDGAAELLAEASQQAEHEPVAE